MLIQHTQATNKLSCKDKNGDALGVFSIEVENLMFFLVADGVGSYVGDYKASKTVVDTFYTSFISIEPKNNLKKRIAKALEITNSTLLNEEGYYNGMKSTLVLAVLDTNKHKLYYVSIGDSRIYNITKNSCKQITKDQVKTIVRRKQDGTPLTLGGVIINATGITNALGTKDFNYSIKELTIKETQSFLMATDGFYDKLHESFEDINAVANAVDVNIAFKEVSNLVFSQQEDDATAIFFRVVFQNENSKLSQSLKIPESIFHALNTNNIDSLNSNLDFIENNELKLPFEFYDNTIKQLIAININDSDIYQRLVSLLKQCKR